MSKYFKTREGSIEDAVVQSVNTPKEEPKVEKREYKPSTYLGHREGSLADAVVKAVNEGLSAAQKKLPPALQKAIKKKEKNENYEVGTKERRDHTIETTPGQSKEDFEKQVEVMHKKKNSMREALAKMWGIEEKNNKNPFDNKQENKYNKGKKEGRTMTGKPETKVEVEPEVNEKKK